MNRGKPEFKRYFATFSTMEARQKKLNEALAEFSHAELVSPVLEHEALIDFLNGTHLSCIYACAVAIEETFRGEYINNSVDKEKAEKEILGLEDVIKNGNNKSKKFTKYVTFGVLINKCRNIKRLEPCLDDAEFLLNLRNEIAVHPMHISPLFSVQHPKEAVDLISHKDTHRRLNTLFTSIKRYIRYVGLEEFKGLAKRYLQTDDRVKRFLKAKTAEEFQRTKEDAEWVAFAATGKLELNEPLALEAFKRMKRIRHALDCEDCAKNQSAQNKK